MTKEKYDEFTRKLNKLCREYEEIGIWISCFSGTSKTSLQVIPPVIQKKDVIRVLSASIKAIEESYEAVDLPKMN